MGRITRNFNAKNLKEKAAHQKKSNKKLVKKLKQLNYRKLDEIVHSLHYHKFEEANCLECANCCKSISPIITYQDINRIAKHLKEKPSKLIEQYFSIDEDDDYVFRKQPCPFLGEDNYCSIYDHRPRACRDYPLTDRIKFYQALDVSVKNTAVCPVVYEIFEDIKQNQIDTQ